MANKTFATYLSELTEVSSLGTGDKVPLLESGTVKYVDGADIGGGGGITALTGDVTASGTGSVAATIANLAVTNAKVATGIDAVKIADGSVTNAEFQYLGSVTSDIQAQINAKQASDATLTAFAALTITSNSITIGTGADAFSQTAFVANTFPARASTGSLEQKTITDFALSLLNDADAATARTTLGVPGYLSYVALLSQTGTDAPVATVLENTLGGTVVWARSDVGQYSGTLAAAFTANKTAIFLGDTGGTSASGRTSGNAIFLITNDSGGSNSDEYLFETPIEIRVYP